MHIEKIGNYFLLRRRNKFNFIPALYVFHYTRAHDPATYIIGKIAIINIGYFTEQKFLLTIQVQSL